MTKRKSLKSRSVISIESKMKIITLSEEKYKNYEIANIMGYGESTIRGILEKKKQIKAAYDSISSHSAQKQYKIRSNHVLKIEEMLYRYIVDCNKKYKFGFSDN